MFFIGVKTNRATSTTKLDDETDIYDSHGSTKIALIAINRSIEALSFLYEQIKEKEDDILDFLVSLSRIKKQLEKQFPKAWEFIRPGFDD